MAVAIRTKLPPSPEQSQQATGITETLMIDAESLERDLRAVVRGEVRFSAADRGMYSADASNYRMIPLGVVLPLDAEDAVNAVAVARRYGTPIFARGGGTGIPGQTVNDGLLFDFSKYMHRVLALDPDRRRARVQPGTVLDTLRAAAEKHHLTFGPDPATHSRCTLGGMIGNNSCGIHSVMAGRTSDNIAALDVLTYDGTRMQTGETSDEEFQRIISAGGRRGEIYAKLRDFRDKYADLIRREFPRIPRRVSGYNLPELLPENKFNVARALVGSECTCVLVLEAETVLVESPPVRSLLVLGYKDIFTAADHVTEPLPFHPIGLEAMDDRIIDDMKKKGIHPPNLNLMPAGRGWLLVEFGGHNKAEADASARRLMDELKKKPDPPSMKLFDDPKQEALVWHFREEGLGATAKVPGERENHEGWEDSAVPPDKLGSYLRALSGLMDKYNYRGALYGHFGQGCVHTRLDFDLETADGIAHFRHFLEEAADLVVKNGGSLSGEHGDGQARGELLTRMFSPEMMQAFREFKTIWDPGWKMNPGKLIEPYRVDENLRFGTDYNPPQLKTHFQFPDDKFSFAWATERCVGAGVCRRHGGGTMCPSYMVTLEEKHSTRGRARLLGEMVRGETITDGWHSEAVKEALDLCLACKGCKGECPVQVDMAAYKSEFLSHYYEGRLRPRTAWTMGQIHLWSRLAALAPQIANFFTQTAGFREIARLVADIDPHRTIPAFAPFTFREWFRQRQSQNGKAAGEAVILWADTFNNHFHPATAQAAVEVLEAAGFRVVVPMRDLCCGRPLHDWGMLDQARQRVREILEALKAPIEAGASVVVLEPSCASVFRDELLNFFPNDENAKRLSQQTMLLSEFLERKAPHFKIPALTQRALVQGHCHHKSLWKMDDEEAILKKMKVDFDVPDSGCCGMAGAFGFERGQHYEVSLQCGERVLLPEVRAAAKDTIIIADGFSCREQIAQTTDRQALHLAQVIQMALNNQPAQDYPERTALKPEPLSSDHRALKTAAIVGAGMLVGGLLWWSFRKR
ncbi:MAG: FAD-binding and (Fe-S)-binding domain-containing protein [Blastocatellia bacterium]